MIKPTQKEVAIKCLETLSLIEGLLTLDKPARDLTPEDLQIHDENSRLFTEIFVELNRIRFNLVRKVT